MNRTYRALAVGLLAVLASAGCVPQGPTLAPWLYESDPATDPVPQPHVVVIGDSLTDQAAADAKPAWKPTGDALSYQAFGATRWQHWYERFGSVPEGSIVEVLLGTNNLTLEDIDTAKANIVAGLDILRDRRPACIVWLSLNTTSASYRGDGIPAETAELNAWMQRAADAGHYPLVIVPWDELSAGHPEYLRLDQGDPVHYTEAGIQAYVDAQLRGPGQCSDLAALPG